MKKLIAITSITAIGVASVIGCGASSSEEQRRAQTHQHNSDKAADRGNYGVAGEEQRAAADAHHRAVKKAIDEGQPIPPQTRRGDPPPAEPQK